MGFSLDSSGVKRGLANASASIKNFAQGANERLGQVAKMVSVGLAAAFVGFGKKALDLGTTLSDIAASTGFATEEFQVFRGALIDAGGKAESMEKGINNMQKAIVQGGEGLTTFTRAFERLGLSVDDLRAMKPEDQFQTIAKAVAEADDRQGAYTSSMEIFGTKVAPRMMEVFDRLGKDGYQKMASDVEEAYGIMDATTQASLDKAADSIERFKNKATIKVGELISGEANFAALKALGLRVGATLAEIGEKIINTLVGGVKTVGSALAAGFEYAWETAKKGTELLALNLSKAIAPIVNSLADVLGKVGITIEKWDVSSIQAQIDSIHFDNPIQRITELTQKNKQAWDDVLPPLKGAGDAWNELADTYERQAKTAGVVEEQLKKNREEAEKAAAAAAQGEKEISKERQLQIELQEALLRGDEEAAKYIQGELDMLKKIEQVKKQFGLDDEAARLHVEQMIAKEKEKHDAKMAQEAAEKAAAEKRKEQELEILKAQADGNDALAAQLSMRVDKEQEALDLMKEFNISLEEATKLAAKLAAMRAGPDLNQSGIVTPREQAKWEEQQKDRQRIADKQLAQEMQDEREIANRWENVSEKRRQTGSPRIRSLEAEDRNLRRRENKELGDAIRRGGDVDALRADIAARRAKRQQGLDLEQQLDQVNRNRDMNIQERTAERKRLRGEQKRLKDEAKQIEEARRKGGPGAAEELRQKFEDQRRQEKADELRKQAEDARKAGDDQLADDLKKQAEDVQKKPGDAPDQPKEPKKPEDKMIDALGGKIDTTNDKLEDIKKLLTC